jgi:hypothetical protein
MKVFATTLLVACLASFPTHAQDTHNQHMKHGAQMADALPTEAGQAAFATIQEIVSKLEADPKTDWSKVNIEALRQHLIDMDNVTLRAVVTTDAVAQGVRYTVTGEGSTVASIQRMVLAHAATMNGVNGLMLTAKALPIGAELSVKTGELQKAKALGFIGMMTIGMHHQQHHWMIANGKGSHE